MPSENALADMSINNESKLNLYRYVSKYVFGLENYLFKPTWDATGDVEIVPETKQKTDETASERTESSRDEPPPEPILIEALKKFHLPEQPSVNLWEILADDDIAELKTMNATARRSFVAKKIKQCHGVARFLLAVFIQDVLKFCDQNGFDCHKTKVALTIFLRTHQYFLYRTWSTPDEVFGHFKHYMFYHNVDHVPARIKTFSVYDCDRIVRFFCGHYMRFLPLVLCLMMPNYGLRLAYGEPFDGENKEEK